MQPSNSRDNEGKRSTLDIWSGIRIGIRETVFEKNSQKGNKLEYYGVKKNPK